MSVLFVSLSLMLSLLCATVVVGLGHASGARVRAQTAADAAALAAVYESGPYGSADPEPIARTYARLNGARLTDCDCVAGASEMSRGRPRRLRGARTGNHRSRQARPSFGCADRVGNDEEPKPEDAPGN